MTIVQITSFSEEFTALKSTFHQGLIDYVCSEQSCCFNALHSGSVYFSPTSSSINSLVPFINIEPESKSHDTDFHIYSAERSSAQNIAFLISFGKSPNTTLIFFQTKNILKPGYPGISEYPGLLRINTFPFTITFYA